MKHKEPWLIKLFAGKELEREKEHLKQLHRNEFNDSTLNEIAESRIRIKKCRQKARQRIKIALSVILLLLAILLAVCFIKIISGVITYIRNSSPKENIQTESVVEETQTETQADTTTAESTELVMSFTGDCILGTDEFFAWDTGFNAYYENYGSDYFFKNVRPLFEKDDITVVNMEGTLTERTTRVDKQFAFKGDPDFVKILSGSSVEAANVANNHSHDYGEQSYRDTVKTLEQNNIKTFGYDNIAILEVKQIKVGFFGIYELDDHLEREPQVLQNIEKLKARGADIIVAVFHWGNELEHVPDSNELYFAHLAIDHGADLVVGHHPHVLQGFDEYKGKTIAYSLGNFCFGGNSNPTEYETAILQMKFTLNKQKEILSSERTILPCLVSSSVGYNDYQPMIAEGEEADRIMDIIQERSDAINQ